MSRTKKSRVLLLSLLVACAASSAMAKDRPSYVRAVLGNSEITDKDLYVKGIDEDTGEEVVFSGEYSTDMPYFGIEGQMPFKEGRLELGIESALMVGWKTDSINIYGNNNNAVVTIDNRFKMLDLSFGGFIGFFVTEKLRFYAGAGAAYIVASVDLKEDEVEDGDSLIRLEETDSDNSFGQYAHAGFEYWYDKKSAIGLSGRYMDVDMNFNKSLGEVEMESKQILLTFTQVMM